MKKWVEVLATDPSPQSATAILFPSGWEGRKRKGKKKEKQREKEIEWEESEEEQIIINLPGSLQWQYRNRPPFLRYYHSLPLSAFSYFISFIFYFSFLVLQLPSTHFSRVERGKEIKKKSLARKKKKEYQRKITGPRAAPPYSRIPRGALTCDFSSCRKASFLLVRPKTF